MSDHSSMNNHAGDPEGVTPSAGISWMMYVFLTVALIVIFWQGSNVILSSPTYHAASGDGTKVDLPPSHL